ncbi:MAG: hypothetical protein ACRDHY_01115, partial [Anaerolineales bacterium]
VEGAAEGLPGLVEVLGLPQHSRFYLAFRAEDGPALHEWAVEDCGDWRELALPSGLPSGWTLAAVGEAVTDRGPRALDPAVAFPDRISIRLVGGIRSSTAGNTFFSFAPPRLLVDGIGADEAVHCGSGVLVEEAGAPGTYPLPEDLPADTRTVAEIRRGDDVIRRVSFYLASGFAWQLDTPVVAFDGHGTLMADPSSSDGIVGAAVAAAGEPFRGDMLRTPGLSPVAARRVYFIGKHAGAISVWPTEPLPSWEPVWAIPFVTRGRPLYCGTSLAAAGPVTGQAGSRKQVDLWRRVLWQWRKRITPPPDQPFKALWRQYREAARDA